MIAGGLNNILVGVRGTQQPKQAAVPQPEPIDGRGLDRFVAVDHSAEEANMNSLRKWSNCGGPVTGTPVGPKPPSLGGVVAETLRPHPPSLGGVVAETLRPHPPSLGGVVAETLRPHPKS